MNGLRNRIIQTSGTCGISPSSDGLMVSSFALIIPRRYGGTETGIGDDTKPSRDLVCESFEEILGIEEIFAEGCAPCVHTIGIYDLLNKDHSDGEWKKIPDRCIASSIAAGRGVLVATPRHRKATRTQCTIRAPARDHESHSGSGSRKRSGVPSGRHRPGDDHPRGLKW